MTTRPPTTSPTHTDFAPYNPDGPLPPGVTANHVAAAYRSMDLRPKLVLFSLDIKSFTGLPSTRLRRALDRPESRHESHSARSDRQRPAFHDALYNALRNRADGSEDVYIRLVQPAEVTRDERTFLDPTAFRAAVQAAYPLGTARPDEIDTGSTEETLALFALAFGLLQPAEAPAIVAPVMEIAPALARFFGAPE